MNTTSAIKTDFIKFNVSPRFKQIVAKKAAEQGLSLSELGRMLFGAFANDLFASPSINIEKMSKTAIDNFESGKGKTFDSVDGAIKHLHQL